VIHAVDLQPDFPVQFVFFVSQTSQFVFQPLQGLMPSQTCCILLLLLSHGCCLLAKPLEICCQLGFLRFAQDGHTLDLVLQVLQVWRSALPS